MNYRRKQHHFLEPIYVSTWRLQIKYYTFGISKGSQLVVTILSNYVKPIRVSPSNSFETIVHFIIKWPWVDQRWFMFWNTVALHYVRISRFNKPKRNTVWCVSTIKLLMSTIATGYAIYLLVKDQCWELCNFVVKSYMFIFVRIEQTELVLWQISCNLLKLLI